MHALQMVASFIYSYLGRCKLRIREHQRENGGRSPESRARCHVNRAQHGVPMRDILLGERGHVDDHYLAERDTLGDEGRRGGGGLGGERDDEGAERDGERGAESGERGGADEEEREHGGEGAEESPVERARGAVEGIAEGARVAGDEHGGHVRERREREVAPRRCGPVDGGCADEGAGESRAQRGAEAGAPQREAMVG